MCRVRRFSSQVLPAALLALVAGCAPLNFRESASWPWAADEKSQIPDEIVAMWKETVLTTTNRPSTRGFGGRLMFYNARSRQPIKVEGSLVVYAFDEDERAPDDPKPDRKFVFTSEQFAQHYSKSDIGHSYSVWLPWDEVGGPQKTLSLIVNFLPAGGGVVKAEQTRHLLPGIVQPRTELAKPAGQPHRQQVRPVSHRESAPGQANRTQAAGQLRTQRRMSTTTIPMPSRIGNRRRAAAGINSRPVQPVTGVPAMGVPAMGVPAAMPVGQPVPVGYPAAAYPPAYPHQPVLGQPAAPQPSAHSSRARSRPLGGSIAQLTRDHGLWQPRPVGSPFRSPPAPAPQRGFGSAATSAGAWPRSY